MEGIVSVDAKSLFGPNATVIVNSRDAKKKILATGFDVANSLLKSGSKTENQFSANRMRLSNSTLLHVKNIWNTYQIPMRTF